MKSLKIGVSTSTRAISVNCVFSYLIALLLSHYNLSVVQHYNALGEKTKAIVFTRNADNLITEVHTPESLDADGNVIGDPNFKYDYDDQKRLVKVHQLVDRDLSKYRIIEYSYELEAFPNYITARRVKLLIRRQKSRFRLRKWVKLQLKVF